MHVPALKVTETIEVESPSVGCDGGGGRFGHPKIYLDVATRGEAVCPYCSRRYVLAAGAAVGHGH